MTKPIRFRALHLSFVALAVFSCAGEGPAGEGASDPPLQALPLRHEQQPPAANEQHSGSDYQRPTINPQNVVPSGQQSASGGAVSFAGASDSCEELCSLSDSVDCGGGCMPLCSEWRDGHANCIRLLRTIVDCVVASGASCDDAAAGCSVEYAAALEACPVSD